MSNQELCLLLKSVLALYETGNGDRAQEILKDTIETIEAPRRKRTANGAVE